MDLEINSIYNYLVQQLDGKTDDSTFAALQSAFGALDTAYSVYTVANELWKASQTTNNGAQQSEIQGLQGQHDSLEQRVDTLEEKIGISFDNTAIRMGTLGTSIANVDVDVALLKTDLGTSFSSISVLLGSSISDNTNRIDNIIGVSLYNIDAWKGVVIGTTIPAIAVSINSVKLWNELQRHSDYGCIAPSGHCCWY